MILHIIQKSPFSSTVLDDCLKTINKDDAILLIQDGVFAVNHPSINQHPLTIYALQEDLNARGINPDGATTCIGYNEFVELCAKYDTSISWY